MKADVFAHLRTREDNRDSKQRPELHKYSINQLKQGHKHSIMRRHNTHRILKKVNSVIAVSTVEEE